MTSRPSAHSPTSAGHTAAHQGFGLAETLKASLVALAMGSVVVGLGGALLYSERAEQLKAMRLAEERPLSLSRLLSAPALAPVALDHAVHGRALYANSCASCHGHDAMGVGGVGRSLLDSWYIAALNDEELRAFIRRGRPVDHPENTMGMPMPAKGGDDSLGDDDLASIVAYLRGVQDPRRMPELPPMQRLAVEFSQAEKDWALTAAGGDEELAEYIASGSKLFAASCSACHGKDGRGTKGNGPSLVDNTFCQSQDDDTLLAFINKGRDPGDPANTTGVGMPAKGGNPALDDDDILDIIAYVRSLDTQTAQK
jgi:mono/diheme cytochrome c family protein